MGLVSAAMALTQFLERQSPEVLIAFGCGGAYARSGLKNGDLALADREVFGDLGVAGEHRFIPLAELRLPLPEVLTVQQQIDLPKDWQQAVLQSLDQAVELRGRRIMTGTFVSVNRVSGTPELGQELENYLAGGLLRYLHADGQIPAGAYGIPLIELRGISNPCGSRERAQWDLPVGMQVAQQAVCHILQNLPQIRNQLCP